MIGYIKAVIFFGGIDRHFRPKPGANSTTFATSSPRDHNRWGRGLVSGSHRPPAVDLRVGELFPGGRWKHRTNSPSTTSTLMVEIAATTKKSIGGARG